MPARSQYLALDCEMCGTLTGKSMCARVVVVDWKGRAVLDEYVKPSEPVTDYRTFVSGITAEHLEGAPDLATVRAIADSIAVMYQGRVQRYGTKSEVLTPPFDDYTDLLLSSVPEMKLGWLEEVIATRKMESAGN